VINSKKAAEAISNEGTTSIIKELTLQNSQTYTLVVNSTGGPLFASVSWTDRPGNVNTSLNSATSRLINDLDIRITQNSTVSNPWKLLTFNTNGKGDNTVDPYERIDIANPSGSYTITITHKGTLTGGSQNFSLIVTNANTGTTSPAPLFTAIQPFCSGATAPTLPTTSTDGITGVWSPSTVNNTAIGNTTYTFTPNAGQATSTVATMVITVKALPTVSANSGTSNACVGATSTLSNTTSSGVWSSGSTNIATVNSNGVVTGISAGSSIISYTVTQNGCSASSNSTFIVNAAPTVATTTGNTNICVGATTTLINTTATGVWTSASPTIATINASGVVSAIASGTSVISYTVTSNGCSSVANSTITVNSTPNVPAITGATSVCAGLSTTFSNTAANGVWSSATTSSATVNSTGVVTGISGGTSVISYTVGAPGCSTTVNKLITVNAAPVVQNIAGNNSICVGSNETLTNSTNNGVWTSSNVSVATVNSSSGTVSGISAGSSTITYTVSSNGCSTSVSKILTVNLLPTVSAITGNLNVCAGGTTTLNNTTSNGTWSSSNPTNATINNAGVVTGLSAGNTVITYTVVANGCAANSSSTVTINNAPSVSTTTGNNSACVGTSTTLINATAGGTWSSSNPAFASVTNGIVTANSAGSTNITYTVTSNGCSANSITSFTVNDLPVISPITGVLTTCVGSTTALTNTNSGGVWTSSNTTIASVNTAGIVTGNSSGSALITYTKTVNGCSNSTASTITVNSSPSVASITGSSSICIGSTTSLEDISTNGTWNSSNQNILQINNLGVITGMNSGSATVTYTVTENGCSSSASKTITVNPNPIVLPITGNNSLCIGTTISLSNASTNGTWTSSNPSIGSINNFGQLAGLAQGTTIINYTVIENGCSSSVSKSINVNIVPTVPSIAGNTVLCAGTTSILSNSEPNGVWTSSNGSIASINSNGNVLGNAAGTSIITYTVTANGCSGSSTATITVNAVPSVAAITGNNTVCTNAIGTLYNTTANGIWSSSSSSIASINPTTGVVAGLIDGNAFISYTVNVNGCSNYSIYPITIANCSGVNEINENDFLVYPNPARNVISIALSDKLKDKGNIKLFSSDGKLIEQREYTNSNLETIDVNQLSEGIYFIHIENKISRIIVK
jgi:uncharacterized protein YjdB